MFYFKPKTTTATSLLLAAFLLQPAMALAGERDKFDNQDAERRMNRDLALSGASGVVGVVSGKALDNANSQISEKSILRAKINNNMSERATHQAEMFRSTYSPTYVPAGDDWNDKLVQAPKSPEAEAKYLALAGKNKVLTKAQQAQIALLEKEMRVLDTQRALGALGAATALFGAGFAAFDFLTYRNPAGQTTAIPTARSVVSDHNSFVTKRPPSQELEMATTAPARAEPSAASSAD